MYSFLYKISPYDFLSETIRSKKPQSAVLAEIQAQTATAAVVSIELKSFTTIFFFQTERTGWTDSGTPWTGPACIADCQERKNIFGKRCGVDRGGNSFLPEGYIGGDPA
jgi:hypothetical protein